MSEWISYCSQRALRFIEWAFERGCVGLSTFFGKVVVFVLAAHFAALVFLAQCFSEQQTKCTPLLKKKVSVDQVHLQPAKEVAVSESKDMALSKPKTVEKKAAPVPQKPESQKKEASKTPADKKAEVLKREKKELSEAQVKKKVKEELARAKEALRATPNSAKVALSSVKEGEKLFSAFPLSSKSAMRIEEAVAEKLRIFLTLPHHGSLHLALTLTPQGEVETVVVEKADSEKNRQYVEKSLKVMRFTELSSLLEGKKQTLYLLLTSE
jgi:hypothetical protein